ncbi:hypothetical protein ACJDU8_24600 [Clostridium sp. WILCCON 0269]|uniref:Uncharacterized protein n=1 Tax=Candidatus Clostridium eludens TaxID=3381663 RepID=A0ABW8SSX1_9CLOT
MKKYWAREVNRLKKKGYTIEEAIIKVSKRKLEYEGRMDCYFSLKGAMLYDKYK